MHKILKLAAAALAAVTVTGCQQEQKPAVASSRSALDVGPIQRPAPTYALSPQQVTPPHDPKPEVVTTVTPGYHPAPTADRPKKAEKSEKPAKDRAAKKDGAAQEGTPYKVKKGDTLFHIAKTEYGDGKKWTVIASANPGISPQTLKPGQTLFIP